jgi:hypothetical protein
MNKSQVRNRKAVLALAVAGALSVTSSQPAQATIKLNEAMLNAPGTNSTQDYIELKSSTGGVEAFDLYMVMLEGDAGAAGGVGVVDHFVQLTGSTGSNGLFLRHNFSVAINPTPDANTSTQTGSFGHENAAITWMLVSGFDPIATPATTDLDTNDDGVLDSTPWTAVLDAVGVGDGDSNGDRTYAAQFGGADFNINSTGMSTPADGKPECIAFRDADGAMHMVSVFATTAPPVGGPYPVTNGGFTVQNGYVASPGNANVNPTTGARAWVGAAAGSYNVGANWTGGSVPTGVGVPVMFDGGGANTLSLDADATAGVLTFDGGNHTIAAGGGTLTLQVSTGNVQVAGQWGNATVNAPVKLMSATNFRPARSATLTFNNLDTNGQNVTKNSIGVVTFGNNSTPGKGLNIGTLNVSSGGIVFGSDGSKNRVMNVATLTMSGTTSRIDLKDNKIITNSAIGTASGGLYTGVSGQIQKGNNLGAWNGQGQAIFTSMPDAQAGMTSIGVATGEQVKGVGPGSTDTFAGQTITDTSTIAMYTYAGDANLDGTITGDDYSAIDFSILTPGTAGWYNGDFNWDGQITGDDYSAIDFNILAQGAPFPTGASAGLSGGVAAVPEPASLTVAGLGAFTLLGARRRNRRD